MRRITEDRVGITLDETVRLEDLADVVNLFASVLSKQEVSALEFMKTSST